ncbi:MAG: DUF4276 family protein [Desulfuromonadales bacterium]
MVEVIVFAEGPTEEQFIKRVVAPVLRPAQIFVKPQMLYTSQEAKGGAVSFGRLKFNARNTLRQKPEAVLSTFLDLYGLATDFPNFEEAKQISDVYARVACLETALHAAIIEHVGCRTDRFMPHIQPHEYEGLLFSDVVALSTTEPAWGKCLRGLEKVRALFATPEHINDNYETSPSRRLENLLEPKYKKTRHGPLAAERITLSAMERECVHFRVWMDTLRRLAVA